MTAVPVWPHGPLKKFSASSSACAADVRADNRSLISARVPGHTCVIYIASISRAARRIGTSAACSLAGSAVMFTSIVVGSSAGSRAGSAPTLPIARHATVTPGIPSKRVLLFLFAADIGDACSSADTRLVHSLALLGYDPVGPFNQ